MLVPVILSGGAGTRLWPLTGERTLIQETALRAKAMPGVATPLGEDDIVRLEDHYGRKGRSD